MTKALRVTIDSPAVTNNLDVSAPLRMVQPTAARPLALRIGFDFKVDVTGPTPMLLMLQAHPEEAGRLAGDDAIVCDPPMPVETFIDPFGNKVCRIVPSGPFAIRSETLYRSDYTPEPQPTPTSLQHGAGELPPNVLPYLLGSRYCEVDALAAIAWDQFGSLKNGGERALAINTWVFEHIKFGYKLTRSNKTAVDTYYERNGVCRDMMHLAITFCRALNIPARYATGYLGDIDADPDPTPMDYSAFYEVYLGGQWWPMDARHGKARVGRVLMARGRDAADVALITSFGRHKLTKFTVITDEIVTPMPLALSA